MDNLSSMNIKLNRTLQIIDTKYRNDKYMYMRVIIGDKRFVAELELLEALKHICKNCIRFHNYKRAMKYLYFYAKISARLFPLKDNKDLQSRIDEFILKP